jgi:2-methylcitrate dehydratase PrpD
LSTAADRLAEFALGLTPADIPEEVRAAAKLHVLDALGCGLAGAATQTATEARAVAALEGGAAKATVIGLRLPLPAAAAAMANGMLFHGLDYDDTLAATGTHLSAVAAPTVLAMGERVRSGGGEVLTAFVGAAESVAAIGLAAPFAMHRRGFHATSVYGVFGAALASARLLGLDHDRAVAALGIAGSFASGIFEYLADGSPTKPIHAG